MFKRMFVIGAVTVALMASMAPASAARSTIEPVEDAPYYFGQEISFTFEAPRTDRPWLVLECYAPGTKRLIYWENRAGFEGGYRFGDPFTLGPSLAWPSGEADCVGILRQQKPRTGLWQITARVKFSVEP